MNCHFCGSEKPDCDCTTPCAECGHIGHEHYADGRCRGTNYDAHPTDLIEEHCDDHEYVPVTA